MAGSLALLTDALHNLSDVISLIVSLVAQRLSTRQQTHKHTFGFKKAEIIAAFINAATLIVVAGLLGVEAVKRFNVPVEVESQLVIILSLVAIAGNGFSVLLLRRNMGDNMNMKSAYLHMLADMLTSVAVLIGGVIMYYYEVFWVDSALALAISLYLFYLSFQLLVDAVKVLLLFSPPGLSVEEISQKVCALEEVKNIHHIHVWQMGEDDIYFEGHVDLNTDMSITEFEVILEKIEHLLHEDFGIHHTIIQPEINKDDDKGLIVQD